MISKLEPTLPSAPQGGAERPVRRAAGFRGSVGIGVARTTVRLASLTRHNGSSLPGMACERIWPATLPSLASQLESTVLVIGTNGKTTTAGLIAEILSRADGRPIANRSGANMRQGIVSSLVRASDLHGRLRRVGGGRRRAVFEVDELALEQILPDLGPAIIIATNLYRDQVDRYGEADTVVDRWAAAMATATPGSILVHCADDPRLTMLGSVVRLPTITFGLAGPPADRQHPRGAADPVADPVACRTCGRQLDYAWRSIGHLGDFACPNGHVRRPTPDVIVESVDVAGESPVPIDSSAGSRPETPRQVLRIGGRFGEATAKPAYPGLTGAYNVAGAVTVGAALGWTPAQSCEAVDGAAGPFGRDEWLEIDGRHVILTLIKNTVSLAETVAMSPRLAADVVLLGLNDAPADGRDISWIWDAPIADLVAGRAVVLTGSRRSDLQLRLKYDPDVAASPPRSVEQADDLEAGLDQALARVGRGGTIVAAATYTAMMGLRTIAERRGDAPPAPL